MSPDELGAMADDPGFRAFLDAMGVDSVAELTEDLRAQLEDSAYDQLPTLALRTACLAGERIGMIGPPHAADFMMAAALSQVSSACSLVMIAHELRLRRLARPERSTAEAGEPGS